MGDVTTEAGRALRTSERCPSGWACDDGWMSPVVREADLAKHFHVFSGTTEDIAAVEDEARADLLDRLAAGVNGLVEHPDCICGPVPAPTVNRATVLALIEEARK